MIEHLRKYTVLIMVVMALIFAGLMFFNRSVSRGGGEDPIRIVINGTSLTFGDYQKLGPGSAAMVTYLGGDGMQGLQWSFGYPMGMEQMSSENQDTFVTKRILLRNAAKDFGVSPSDEEVAAAVKEIPAFKGPTGSFNQDMYNKVVQNFLPRQGLMEKDLFDLARDILLFKTMGKIIGGGLSDDRQFATNYIEAHNQRLTVQTVQLPLSKYVESLKPTDEELKAAWETSKAKYLTGKHIKVSYVIAAPVYPEAPKEDAPLPEGASAEDKKAAEVKKAEQATALAEEKRKINKDLGAKVNALLLGLDKSDGASFEKLAEEQGMQVKTTEMFPLTDLPKELADLKLRSASSAYSPETIGGKLQNLSLTGGGTNRYTGSISLENGQYLIARADEIQEPREKTFDEARDDVSKDYIAEHSKDALKKDADEKAAKIRQELAAGKTFADIAKEMELEVKDHAPFSASDPKPADPDAAKLFEPCSTVDPGTLADPIVEAEDAVLAFVEKREIVKDPNRNSQVDMVMTGIANKQRGSAFVGWLQEQLEAAKIQTPKHR